eukprot:5949379-Amphidinium_carterae.1
MEKRAEMFKEGRFIFYYKNKQMDDDHTVSDYNIQKDDIINMFFPLLGGGGSVKKRVLKKKRKGEESDDTENEFMTTYNTYIELTDPSSTINIDDELETLDATIIMKLASDLRHSHTKVELMIGEVASQCVKAKAFRTTEQTFKAASDLYKTKFSMAWEQRFTMSKDGKHSAAAVIEFLYKDKTKTANKSSSSKGIITSMISHHPEHDQASSRA